MSVLNQLASALGRRDELPNQELARALVRNNDLQGIAEIGQNLLNKDKFIQRDCIKVLYEIGYLKPEFISEYTGEFLKLLSNRDNNVVWRSMIALTTTSQLKADDIFKQIDLLESVIREGSVITRDAGIKVMATVAKQNERYRQKIYPFLLNHLKSCRPKDVPQHAESIFPVVGVDDVFSFCEVLNDRKALFNKTQLSRVNKLIKHAESL